MRTIISGIDTTAERFAKVAEYELDQHVVESPSYLRDTTDYK